MCKTNKASALTTLDITQFTARQDSIHQWTSVEDRHRAIEEQHKRHQYPDVVEFRKALTALHETHKYSTPQERTEAIAKLQVKQLCLQCKIWCVTHYCLIFKLSLTPAKADEAHWLQ